MVVQELYLAGEKVQPGRYKRVDSGHVVVLEHEDVLPAAMDGQSTSYTRIQFWNDINNTNRSTNSSSAEND